MDSAHLTAPKTPIVSSESWQPAGAEAEREGLSAYLQRTALSVTIQNAMDLAVRAMRVKPGDRVIDVGCGAGFFLPKLAAAAGPDGSIVAFDHARGFLDDAQSLMNSIDLTTPIKYVLGDALALPFPDASFDSAHTERVLIHLSDPDLGLRELRRIVKPGGWVGCVEPDLDGMRIDHVDTALGRLIVSGFTETIRFPAMGLELNRRMAAAGLIDRAIETLTEVERDMPADVEAVFRSGAVRLASEGRLGEETANDAISWLAAQSAMGRYTSYTSMFIVAGRVPDV